MMLRKLSYWVLVAVCMLSALRNIKAEESRGFYAKKAQGWFWYESMPVEKKRAIELNKPAFASLPSSPPKENPLAKHPLPFSAAWFRQNLQKYKDAAWDKPTPDNIRAFLYLQRFAVDRSEQFADGVELVTLGDPSLDELSRRPSATFASQQIDRQAGMDKIKLVKSLTKRLGIFFFFRSDCPYCELQAPLIKVLEQNEGFTVIPVSLDGQPLPSHLFPNFKVDEGHAQKLGIQTVPALFLATADGEFAAIGQGVMSLPEINHRILVAAKRKNWLSEKAFNQARPVMNVDDNAANYLSSPAHAAEQLKPIQPPSNDGFIPPAKLVDFLKKMSKEP